MLQEITIKANKRDGGKQIAKTIRKEGLVPGVFYAKDIPSLNISINNNALRPVVYTSHVKLINLDIEGDIKKCVLKDVKFDPVTDKIIHFDLLGISEHQKLTVEVPFEFVGGQPVGVRKGGSFQQVFHKCKITCLPKDLVSSLEVNIESLDLGQAIHLRDIVKEGIEYGVPEDSLICAVNVPRGKAGEALREEAKK